MRKWYTAIVVMAGASWLVHAQPPANPPGKIIIEPKRPADPQGTILIRPGGKTTPTPQPAQPNPATTPPAVAPVQPEGKLLYDYWFIAAVEGKPIGYLRWTARAVEKDGKTLWFGTKSQRFTVSRFGQVVTMFAEESSVEQPDGAVLLTTMRQGIGANQFLALTGRVEGNALKVKGEGAAAGATDSVPWPAGVVGVAREPLLFAEKRLKPGESFDYPSYTGQMNRVIRITTTFEGEETLPLWQNQPPKKVHRYVSRMQPVGNVKLPPSTTWCDPESGEPLLVVFKFAGLGGRVSFLRTTESVATRPVTEPLELFNAQSIRLDREIPGIHSKASAVYKITVDDDDDPATVFATDGRQVVKNLDLPTKTLELHVNARHGPVPGARAEPAPGKEFLGSSYFINWENDTVKAHAAKAIAGLPAGANAWDRARAVERWVKANMRAFEFSQAMATADHVARTLTGDCTEYAMLSAAMCRALAIPSRTVLGLVYAPSPGGKPYLAYHMWFEVYAEGQWLPLDATLGLGGVGPGHVKITDHSWHEERSFAPLLPVLRVLTAKPAVTVLEVK